MTKRQEHEYAVAPDGVDTEAFLIMIAERRVERVHPLQLRAAAVALAYGKVQANEDIEQVAKMLARLRNVALGRETDATILELRAIRTLLSVCAIRSVGASIKTRRQSKANAIMEQGGKGRFLSLHPAQLRRVA